jgi:hypothetical protein
VSNERSVSKSKEIAREKFFAPLLAPLGKEEKGFFAPLKGQEKGFFAPLLAPLEGQSPLLAGSA